MQKKLDRKGKYFYRDWRDGSILQNICCFFWKLELNSKHPGKVTQSSKTPAPEHLKPLWPLRACPHAHTCNYTKHICVCVCIVPLWFHYYDIMTFIYHCQTQRNTEQKGGCQELKEALMERYCLITEFWHGLILKIIENRHWWCLDKRWLYLISLNCILKRA